MLYIYTCMACALIKPAAFQLYQTLMLLGRERIPYSDLFAGRSSVTALAAVG